MEKNNYCYIAFPIDQPAPYTYKIPINLVNQLKPGMRVLAPFGFRIQIGYCMETMVNLDKEPSFKLKSIKSIVDDQPLFTESQLTFLKWIARYYLAPVGQVCKSAHPSESGSKRIPSYFISEGQDNNPEILTLSHFNFPLAISDTENCSDSDKKHLTNLLRDKKLYIDNVWTKSKKSKRLSYVKIEAEPEDILKNTQRTVYNYLKSLPDKEAAISVILKTLKISASPINTLIKHNILKKYDKDVNSDPFKNPHNLRHRNVILNEDQEHVINVISEHFDSFFPVLLHGITGSGKTEVYIELAKQALSDAKDTLILVPEISLTPQIAGRFRAVFNDKVAIWHSQMSSSERLWTWNEIQKGRIKVVVGARSAIFSPLNNLGIIIVDEEHENSYKQEDPAPRYHARDAAVYYANQLKIPIVLGSATPSLESYYQSFTGKYHKLKLDKRFGAAKLPRISIVNMGKSFHHGVFSQLLLDAISKRIEKGEQIILLQNRRGFNTSSYCSHCGKTVDCPACSVSLTWHKHIHQLRCHYCGYITEQPKRCPHCGDVLSLKGTGTQKVEITLSEYRKDWRIARMDFDTTHSKNAHISILNKFENKEFDILLGTQMIAKGLDFENVTLVGIISAETGLGFADFRSNENVFQLISQVSGRAGRGQKKGEVIIQSYTPDAPAIMMAAQQDLLRFYNQELSQRKELNYPPFSRIALIHITGKEENLVIKHAKELAHLLNKNVKNYSVMGPASSPINRIKGNYRQQILLKADKQKDASATNMRKAIAALNQIKVPSTIKVSINIDPVSML